jgi:predicted nucleic acid-binding protein
MKSAFWDSSALVPFCARQKASQNAHRLVGQYQIVVWWATPVEIRSALERLLRMGQLSATEYSGAERRLDRLRHGWREVRPDDAVRAQAEILLRRFPLSAADALQLAAAMTWAGTHPRGHVFICGDARLLHAAEQLGFRAVEA